MPIFPSLRRHILNYGRLLAGNLLLSLGLAIFILPYDLNVGGMTGIALVLERLLPWELLTVDRWVFLLSWLLFFFGWITMGRAFALRTLFSTVVYPLSLSLFLALAKSPHLAPWLDLSTGPFAGNGVLIGALFGGILVGAGCGLCYLSGGSTGGLDILALWLSRRLRRIKKSTVVFLLDATAIVLGFLTVGDLVRTLLGILSAFVSAFVIERMFIGSYGAYVAQIVSERYLEINRGIIEQLDRTSTILDGHGGYTGEERKMLTVSFRMSEYPLLLSIIERNDPDAFVTIQQAHAINGNGWRPEDEEKS